MPLRSKTLPVRQPPIFRMTPSAVPARRRLRRRVPFKMGTHISRAQEATATRAMRISGPIGAMVGFCAAITLCAVVLLLMWHSHWNANPARSAERNSTPQQDEQAAQESSGSGWKTDDQILPPESGHSYHAYELLFHPDSDIGKLVKLDPASVPVLNPRVPDFVTYIKLRSNDAVVAGMVGLRYSNDI